MNQYEIYRFFVWKNNGKIQTFLITKLCSVYTLNAIGIPILPSLLVAPYSGPKQKNVDKPIFLRWYGMAKKYFKLLSLSSDP